MMLTQIKKSWPFGVIILVGLGCNQVPSEQPSEALLNLQYAVTICDPEKYDLTCAKSENTNASDGILDLFSNIEKTATKLMGEPISDQRQDEYGDNTRKEVTKEFPIIANHKDLSRITGIMHKLLKYRKNPSEIGYNIYVVQSQMVNAFTVGGEIYVTEELIKQSQSNDELACIIGHEIGHNELGHIREQLQKQEIAQGILGEEGGNAFLSFVGLLTMGFNQKNELQSDFYGIDLALAAGFNPCRGIAFWDRLMNQEGEENELENFFRSHPYSAKRGNCNRNHNKEFHSLTCQ